MYLTTFRILFCIILFAIIITGCAKHETLVTPDIMDRTGASFNDSWTLFSGGTGYNEVDYRDGWV